MANTRRSAPFSLLDKNYIFLNTKGLCLLCYDECPVQTLDKRKETTQTSINFLRLVSRYLEFNVDNVVVAPLKKVGRKCVLQNKQQQQNDANRKVDKVGFELCERCASLANAFCQVQFQVQFHQMILDRCVRSISEIIKDANKKTAAELFTLSEEGDPEANKKQQKTFTRLTLGGLRSANILRNKLYKKSVYKLSKSFPVIKLKRICKSGDWIRLLNKDENKDLPRSLPVDSKDVIFASLLGCVVSFWIVLSLSFINPEEFAFRKKEEKARPSKMPITPMPLINCDELEIELKFPSKKKSTETLEQPVIMPKSRRSKRSTSAVSTSSSSINTPAQAQQKNDTQVAPQSSTFTPVVIHKHSTKVVKNNVQLPGSQYPTGEAPPLPPYNNYSDQGLMWKPKSNKYPTSLQPVLPPTPPSSVGKVPAIAPSPSPSQQQYVPPPPPQYPYQSPQYTLPTGHTSRTSSSPSAYNSMYPPYPNNQLDSSTPPSSSSANHYGNGPPLPSSSISQQPHSHHEYNQTPHSNPSGNCHYSYNFTAYSYHAASSWPSYSSSADTNHPPPPTYPSNGVYNDPYASSQNAHHDSGAAGDLGYDYSGYNYNNPYHPPSQPLVNNYHQSSNSSAEYMPNLPASSSNGLYSEPNHHRAGYHSNHQPQNESTYTTLLPSATASTSNSYTNPPNFSRASASSAPVPMDVDTSTTNTSTSDEPSLTHEDPQPFDSENSSINGDDCVIDSEADNDPGGPPAPHLMFPESHWRQQAGNSSQISCNKPGCTEQFSTPIQLQLHLRAHGMFKCSFCHLTFSKAHNLAQHEKMRHCKSSNCSNGRSKCPRCDYTSTSQYKYFLHFLTYHLNIHLYDKPCQICNKPFILGTKMINRKNHFRCYHDVEGKDCSTIFTCRGCDAPFLKEAQLRDHKPNCTEIASVSSQESLEEITRNTALATADQIVI